MEPSGMATGAQQDGNWSPAGLQLEPNGAATGAQRGCNWGPAGLQPADEINIPKLSHLQQEFIKRFICNRAMLE